MPIRRAGWLVWIASGVLSLAAAGCGDDDDAPDAGSEGGKGGKGGSAGSGGAGTRSAGAGREAEEGSAGEALSAGRSGSNSGGSGPTAGTSPGSMCSEPPPTGAVTCGGQTCEAPVFAMNSCVIPCCLQVDGQERCAARSTSMTFATECALPAVEDPECPDVPGDPQPYQGCCNPVQKKCGIISTVRPGCVTQSQFIELPNPPKDCGSTTPEEDAGVEPDAG
jgi:hypothetical protein